MTGQPIAQASTGVTGDYGRRHFVHVYAVIRVKVAVEAPDHRRAMEAADKLLFAGGPPVRLVAMSSAVLDADHPMKSSAISSTKPTIPNSSDPALTDPITNQKGKP